MPIYEYQCQNCGHKLEVMQSIHAEPLLECPECTQKKLSRLVSAAGFQLKGTGWYETDYKNKGKKPSSDESKKTEDKPVESKAVEEKKDKVNDTKGDT